MSRIEELKAFITEDPGDRFSAYALALEYIKISNYSEAVLLLEELISRHPDYLPVYYQLGKLYELQHDVQKASSVFVKGMDIAREQKNQKTLNELKAANDMLEDE